MMIGEIMLLAMNFGMSIYDLQSFQIKNSNVQSTSWKINLGTDDRKNRSSAKISYSLRS